MTRRRAHIPLNVFLNSRLVGSLRRESTGATDFQYAKDWLTWENTFPISLSLPLREDRYIGAPVINVFDNLLPDSDAIRKRVAERVGAGGTDAYSLLAVLGHADDLEARIGLEVAPQHGANGRRIIDDQQADWLTRGH